MQRSRAYRRHQFIKAKKRAIRYLYFSGLPIDERNIRYFAKDRKPCSFKEAKYRDTRHKYNIGVEANG